MEKQIRVLMLVPNLRVSNGVASYAMSYYRSLDHKKVRMDFACYWDIESPYFQEIEEQGDRIFFLPPVKKIIEHLKNCKKIILEGGYDVVHDNSVLITYPMMKLAKKYVPVRILHSHNSKLGETKKKEKRNAFFLPRLRRQANAYAACSDLAAKAMFGDADYERLPNVVDAEIYTYDPLVRDRVRSEMDAVGKKVIATVGRAANQKNPFFALDVFDIVAEREPDSEYWWIGSGPLDQKVAEYAKGLRHGDRVRLLGSRNDVKELYQAADLFFLPSLFEGLPVTVLEAQAMGLPCIISDSVTREVVYTDLVTFVSLSDSKDKWVDVIKTQLGRIPARRTYIEELKRSAFSTQNAGERLSGYYKALIEKRSADKLES